MFVIPKFFLNLPGVTQALSLWIEGERMSATDWERAERLRPGEPKGNKEVTLVNTDPARDYFREVHYDIIPDSPTFEPDENRLYQPQYQTNPTLKASATKHEYNFNEALEWISESSSPLEAQNSLENKIQALEESADLSEIFKGPLAEEDYFALYVVAKQRFFARHDFVAAPRVFPSFERFKLYLKRVLSLPGLVMNLNEIAFGILDPDSTFTRLATYRVARGLSWKEDFYFAPYDILLKWPPLNPFDQGDFLSQEMRDFPSISEIQRLLLENVEDDEVLGTFFENLKECTRVIDYMAAFELFKWRVASPQVFKVLQNFPNPMETLIKLKKLTIEYPVDLGLVAEAPGSHLKSLWESATYIVVAESIYKTYGKRVSYEAFESALGLWGKGHVALASLVLATFQFHEIERAKRLGESVFLDIDKAREELQSRGMVLTGVPLLAYALDMDLVKEEKWAEKRGKEILNGAGVRIDFGSFAYLGFPTGRVDIEFNPQEVMIVSAMVQAGGGNLNDFAGLLSQIEIEPSDFREHFPPYEFSIPTQTFSFQKEIEIGLLQQLVRRVRIREPLTLAREILANYQRTIPPKQWRRVQEFFHLKSMEGVERKVSTLVEHEAHALQFLEFLLIVGAWPKTWISDPLGKVRELLDQFLLPKKGRAKPAEKMLRTGQILSILASLTLHHKYQAGERERILRLNQRISNQMSSMLPHELADAILSLYRFLNEELRETIAERREELPTQKQMEKMQSYEEKNVGKRKYWKLFFGREMRPALKKLALAYGKVRSIAGPTVKVSFLAARELVDAFNGHVSGISARSDDYIKYCLSDPDFQPIRILVDGEYKGSFMTYSTTHNGKKALIVASLNAQVYFDPGKFMDHFMEYLRDFAGWAGYQMILIPKHVGSQSYDPTLRREIRLRASGEVDLGQEIYFPKRGPGHDPKKDFYPYSHRHCLVLWEG